jgi:lipopolysaccharide biosynthesis glycosyltransferase
MDNKNIYVGYDESQDMAYNVCAFSIKENTNFDVNIHKINDKTICGYNREHDPLSSTPFTYARFYVPFINDYKGFSIFCDGDFLFLDDIGKLINLFDSKYAVQVVKHDYNPSNATKMNNKIQTMYPRKNWSSLILWNNEHPKNKQLNLDLLNKSTGSFLHRFTWLDDSDIGEISYDWNWLVGWYNETEKNKPKALHFTEGGPWLEDIKTEYDFLWNSYKEKYLVK